MNCWYERSGLTIWEREVAGVGSPHLPTPVQQTFSANSGPPSGIRDAAPPCPGCRILVLRSPQAFESLLPGFSFFPHALHEFATWLDCLFRLREMTVAKSFVFRLVLVPLLIALAGALGEVRAFEEAECTSAYNYLAGCLTFVSGPDTIPNPLCCGGVSQLNTHDPHCLCTIIRELDENPNVNYTKACALPLQCSVAVDVVECPSLALPPGYALPPSLPVEDHASSESGDQSAALVQFRHGGGVTWGISFVGFGISLLGIL